VSTKPITVDFKGPIFKTDAGRAVKKAIGKAISNVAAAGKREVQASLVEGHGKDSGEFRKGIRRKKVGMTAKVYARDARISAWLQGTSSLNRKSRYKGINLWGEATQRTDQGAGEDARKMVAELVKELGG
jgi:hypothetical protein